MTRDSSRPAGNKQKRSDLPLAGFRRVVVRAAQFGLAARRRPEPEPGAEGPVYLEGESHMMTFGPTGSGKSTIVAANALDYRGSMVILDLKGDIVQATARERIRMGQSVLVLDPWNISDYPHAARLDPMDVVKLGGDIQSALESVAATILGDFKAARDAYWYFSGLPLLSGTLLHVAESTEVAKLSINKAVDLLCNAEDIVYALAVLMDNDSIRKDSYQRGAIANFLALPDGNNGSTRTCVLSTVQAGLALLRSDAVRSAMGPSTINILELRDGKPMTIYICLPLTKLNSHAPVVRLWLELIIETLMARTRMFNPPLYMAIDEAAQLGACPALKTVSTFLRSSSVRLHTFFQDMSQLRSLYPTDWQTILNNASTWTFLRPTPLAAQELAAVTGIPAETFRSIGRDEQLVVQHDLEIDPYIVKTPRYWEHPFFAGRFDPVKRRENSSEIGRVV